MSQSLNSSGTLSIADLQSLVRGTVVTPEDPQYDEARSIFYVGLARRPAAVVRPADADDVARVVVYARESGTPLTVRSGGHSPAGHSVVDDGIVLDLRSLNRIDIDAAGRSAWAETGQTAAAYTAATATAGLVTGFGDSGSVGIGGITLGGGLGFLHRKLGLTIDSVLAAEVVTAEGAIRRVDEATEPDLFWAIRGGGGNFGVVTRIRYRLHEIGEVSAGMLALPASPANIVRTVQILQDAPDELSGMVNVMIAPPMPFLPAEYHGKPVIMAMMVHSGDTESAERDLGQLRAISTPIVDTFQRVRYSSIYEEGPEPPRPARVATRCFFTDDVDLASAEAILDALPRSRAPLRVAQFRILGGAVSRVSRDATAFPHRDRPIMALTVAGFAEAADAPEHDAWTNSLADALRRGERGAYIGFLANGDEATVRDAYAGDTWERLRAVKRHYDPENLFHFNQNVKP